MAVANVVAKFEADISDVQAKMAALKKSFNEAGNSADQLGQRFKMVGAEMSRVGKGMTIGLTLPLAAVGAAAVKASVDFESSMSKIVGLVGIAADEVDVMKESVLALAGQTAKSPVELANGLFVVTSAGLRGETAMQALEMSAKAGAAGLGETNDIARALSGALSAYGSDVLSAAAATDAIVATARAGNFETSQFAAAIGRVLPFAKQAGASFQEMGGAVALLTRVNGDAAQSVTQMAALFRAFSVPTMEARTALDEVGLSAGDLRKTLSTEGLPAALRQMESAVGGNREEFQRLLGSSEAVSAAVQILDADAQTLADTFGVVNDSAGMTDEAFNAAADTAGFKMQQAMASLQATLIGIGDIIVPLVTEVAKFAKVLLDGFTALPGPVKTVAVAFAGIVAALGPILWIGGKVVAMFGTMSLAFTAARTKIMGALASLRASFKAFEVSVKTAMIAARTQMGALAAAARVTGVAIGTAFRAAGAAVKGFMASLGPVGFAIIGVSVAYEVLAGRSADAEARVDALTEALSRQGDEAQKAAAEIVAGALLANEWGRFLWIENNVQDFERLAEIAGLSMAEVVTAVIAGGEQMEAVIASFTAAGEAGLIDPLRAAEAISLIQAEAANYVDATKAKEIANQALGISAEVTGEAQRGLTSATVAAAVAAGNAAGPMQGIADVTRTTEAAVRALQTAFNELNAILDKSAAQDRMKASLQAMKDAFADAESSAESNRDSIRTYMRDAMAFAQTLDDPRQQLKVMEGALKDVEKQMKAGEIDPKTSKLYKDMKGAVKAARDEVKTMGDAVGEAKEAGLTVADAIAEGITKGMSDQEAAINAAGMAGGETLETGINSALGISSPSRVAMQAGRNTGIGLIQGLNQMRTAAEGAGMNIAANIVRGMTTALNNGKGPVASAARAIVAAAIAAARDESQEGSPSRVFMRIGDNIVLGLVVGIDRSAPKATGAAKRLVNDLVSAFNAAFAPAMGPIQSAFAEVFANIPSVKEAEKALKDQDNAANRAALAMAKYAEANRKGIKALQELGGALDYITAKMESVTGAMTELQLLTAQPFGQASEVFQTFASGSGIDAVIRGYSDLKTVVTEAYALLTDPKIVGKGVAKANRKEMNGVLRQLEDLTRQAVQLREQYEATVQELAALEKSYQDDVAEINSRYDGLEAQAQSQIKAIEDRWAQTIPTLEGALKSATEAYDRENAVLKGLVDERDKFLADIRSGFRSFVNNLAFDSARGVKAVQRETKQLANGITVTFEREMTGGGAMSIRETLQSRLDEIRQFTRNIKTLMQRGLDPSLVRDFVAAGVSGAGDAAAALASASQDDINAINSIQSELLAEGESFGAYASAQWHDVAIAQQQAIVGPLELARDQARKALDDANALRDSELAAARAHLEQLKSDREKELADRRAVYDAEKARIEAQQQALLTQMDEVAAQIEALIAGLATNLPARSTQAGLDAAQKLLDGFKRKYPELYADMNKLMDRLARSMNRTATVTIRTVYEAADVPARAMGGPVQARTAYLVGEKGPEVFVPYGRGNIIPNHLMSSVPDMGPRSPVGGAAGGNTYQITVNAGVGDPREIGRVAVEAITAYERTSGKVYARA